MWELIANGLNVAGSLASIGSFISSFSVDRDRKSIEKSVQNIERNLNDFNKVFKEIGKPGYLENYLSNLIDSKTFNNITSNEILKAINTASKDQERLIVALSESISEIKNAYHFKKTEYTPFNKNFQKELINDPFRIGISQFWDISEVHSFENFPNKILSNINTPVLWSNPFNGRKFIGEMHNSNLHRFGIDVNIPHYKFNNNGFAYDTKRGLYLPTISILL